MVEEDTDVPPWIPSCFILEILLHTPSLPAVHDQNFFLAKTDFLCSGSFMGRDVIPSISSSKATSVLSSIKSSS